MMKHAAVPKNANESVVPLRILVVDDDEALRRELVEALTHQGHDVEGVADGRKAIERMGAVQPNLVVTDVLMPEMDGIELIREVRSRWPRIKIVAMSSGGMLGAEIVGKSAKGLGADMIVSKPFEVSILMKAVKKLAG